MTLQTNLIAPPTEREVLAAARSIRELQALRGLQQSSATSPRIAVDGGQRSPAIPLEPDEYQAVLALLIERHTSFIASLGIIPEVVPA